MRPARSEVTWKWIVNDGITFSSREWMFGVGYNIVRGGGRRRGKALIESIDDIQNGVEDTKTISLELDWIGCVLALRCFLFCFFANSQGLSFLPDDLHCKPLLGVIFEQRV